MKINVLIFILCLPSFSLFAQVDLSYYLPENVTYNSDIPTPKEVLGYEVGDWHVNNDQLLRYMETVARLSDRVSLEVYARSYENRPLLLLTITSPENHNNIETIKSNHIAHFDTKKDPVVVWLGYSVHGNESSGTNASLLTVYHLAAAQGSEMEELLSNSIILVDPMINPDGNMRFSTWVNARKSKNLIADPQNWEQNEPWPNGRTNHYWFDLNRDWLLLQHPESKGRLAKFHEWKPNVVTDHHEMGTNATFFFQPGIPSRNHPLTPENTFSLTQKIAEYHISALDKIGSLYYSKESFDDFYFGKGSTYPDINGGVGILFEQASARSHLQESTNGLLTFPFTIRNQFTTSLSTLKASHELKSDLLEHQKNFYSTTSSLAKSDRVKAIVYHSDGDPARVIAFNKLINQHQINIYPLAQSVESNGIEFNPESSYIIPLDQPQYRLIKAIFEKRTQFNDSLFYDVSAWTIPLAFDLPFAELTSQFTQNLLGKTNYKEPKYNNKKDHATYAYSIDWSNYYAPKVLYHLLKKGLRCRVATKPFSQNGRSFNYGTLIVPLINQVIEPNLIHALMDSIKAKDIVNISSINSGAGTSGVFLGSNSFKNLNMPSIALIVGNGVNAYDAGEVWHLLDQRFDIDISLLPFAELKNADLSRYNTLIFADGNYISNTKEEIKKLASWVKQGGNIMAMKRAGKWLSNSSISMTKYKDKIPDSTGSKIAYVNRAKFNGAQVIGGAIFNTKIDLTHPIVFGYHREYLPIFKKGALFMDKNESRFINPIIYTENPLISGYVSSQNLEYIKNSPAVSISKNGRGRIVTFTDNPNFRAYWYGTNKLLFNGIFFADFMNP